MPDRAIYMQQCKQFRCAPRESHASRSRAAGKFTREMAYRLSTAARACGRNTHARAWKGPGFSATPHHSLSLIPLFI
jgi:hypothetical protein